MKRNLRDWEISSTCSQTRSGFFPFEACSSLLKFNPCIDSALSAQCLIHQQQSGWLCWHLSGTTSVWYVPQGLQLNPQPAWFSAAPKCRLESNQAQLAFQPGSGSVSAIQVLVTQTTQFKASYWKNNKCRFVVSELSSSPLLFSSCFTASFAPFLAPLCFLPLLATCLLYRSLQSLLLLFAEISYFCSPYIYKLPHWKAFQWLFVFLLSAGYFSQGKKKGREIKIIKKVSLGAGWHFQKHLKQWDSCTLEFSIFLNDLPTSFSQLPLKMLHI